MLTAVSTMTNLWKAVSSYQISMLNVDYTVVPILLSPCHNVEAKRPEEWYMIREAM